LNFGGENPEDENRERFVAEALAQESTRPHRRFSAGTAVERPIPFGDP